MSLRVLAPRARARPPPPPPFFSRLPPSPCPAEPPSYNQGYLNDVVQVRAQHSVVQRSTAHFCDFSLPMGTAPQYPAPELLCLRPRLPLALPHLWSLRHCSVASPPPLPPLCRTAMRSSSTCFDAS